MCSVYALFLIWGRVPLMYVPLNSPIYSPFIVVSPCARIVFPTFPPPLYDTLVPSHPVGVTFDSHTATRMEHTPASRPIPIPRKKQVNKWTFPVPITTGGNNLSMGFPFPSQWGANKIPPAANEARSSCPTRASFPVITLDKY